MKAAGKPFDPVHRTSLGKRIIQYKYMYFLLIPGIVYILIFKYLPMFGLQVAFRDYYPADGIMGFFNAEWIGLQNFQVLFRSQFGRQAIINTINISLLKLVFAFPMPIILALLINEAKGKRFKKMVQSITYLPHFFSWTIVSIILFELLSQSTGTLNIWLQNSFGININFLSNEKTFVPMLVLSDIWKEVGWGSIVYLAALAGVDIDQYEAAIIDGATPLQKLWYITLPGILPTITVMLLLKIGNILDAGFEQIFLLYSPTVYNVADIIDTYVFREGINNMRYGLATAAGLFKSIIALILVLISNRLTKRFWQTSLF